MDINNFQKHQGQLLKFYRKQANLTQQELATKLNLTSQAIANYENGKRAIPNSILLNLSRILNVSIARLLDVPEEEKLPNDFWEKVIKSQIKLEEDLNNDFDVIIVGNIPKHINEEIMDFISFIKHKYGYPKK